MDNNQHITALYFQPDTLPQAPDQFYQAARSRALKTSEIPFAAANLPHQSGHAAMTLSRRGIRALNLPGGALVIIDSWDSQKLADEVFDSRIRPALGSAPEPESIRGIDLIGCVLNPRVNQFNARTAVTNIMCWTDLEVDPGLVNQTVAERLYSQDQPLLPGSGAHFTFRINRIGRSGLYGMVTLGIWESNQLLQTALHDHILPAFTDGFSAHRTKADHDTLPASPLGIAVREEVRIVRP
jgi:hypothetical protein